MQSLYSSLSLTQFSVELSEEFHFKLLTKNVRGVAMSIGGYE